MHRLQVDRDPEERQSYSVSCCSSVDCVFVAVSTVLYFGPQNGLFQAIQEIFKYDQELH